MQTVTYNLNITPGGIPLNIHTSQYDVGLRQYTFQPYTSEGEFEYVAGATVTLEATKPDGFAVVHECQYYSDGRITYTLQEQLTAKPGKVWSKIVIRDGNDVLGTGTIIWDVDAAGVKDDAVISDSDVGGIRGMVEAEVRNALATTLPVGKASGAVASFTDGADNVPVEDLKISIEPVQSGSGDPSPTNVRPISGWTGANVVRTGKNLVQFAPVNNASHRGVDYSITSDGKLTMSGTATGGNSQPYATNTSTTYDLMSYGPFPAGTYTIIANGFVGTSTSDRIIATAIYDDGESFFSNVRISGEGSIIPNGIGRPYTFTATKPFKIGLYILIASGSTVNCSATLQMEVGTTVDEWKQYKGQTYPISFGSAGTVYGGTLDVTSGVLTVDRAIFNAKDKTWRWGGNAYVYTPITDTVLTERTQVVCSHLGFMGGTGTLDGHCSWGGNPNNGNLCARSSAIAPTLADWNTYIASHDVQFVYYLANPQTYQLTPTEVRTLLGINNIWADTGDTEVAYRADTARYIDSRISAQQKLISGVETSYTATKNYAIGDYVIVNDTLYKVTAAIATGATITPGTNATATTVAEQLILLANA